LCRAVHVKLSEEEEKQVAKWRGVLTPVYASLAILLLAAVLFGALPRGGEMIATAETQKTERLNWQE
jgi:hypothetical protein